MVGRAKRAFQVLRDRHPPGAQVDREVLKTVLCRHWRQECGEAFGYHGFTAAGRASHKLVVASSNSDFGSPNRTPLPANLSKVDV